MKRSFCVFGDSVTQAGYVKSGWVEMLRIHLEEKYNNDSISIFNLGINGNTSTDILSRVENEMLARDPSDIIFAIGINDSGYYISNNTPITDEELFIDNINSLIKLAKKYSMNVTFIGLVLGDEKLLQPYSESSTGKSYSTLKAKTYDEIIKKLVMAAGLKYIHLFNKLDFSDFQDGLHPNESGHYKMFEAIKIFF